MMDEHKHKSNGHANTTPELSQQVAELKHMVELVLELLCPKCAPAAIVRMHPELGPQPLPRPEFEVPPVTDG